MSINQRKHIRLTLDIPVFRIAESGEKISVMIYQISIGGCFMEWDESLKKDDVFRMEIQLPNKNFLPLQCQVIYLMKGDGIGVQFFDITQFEQELLAQIITKTLDNEGIPLKIDPFAKPRMYLPETKDLPGGNGRPTPESNGSSVKA